MSEENDIIDKIKDAELIIDKIIEPFSKRREELDAEIEKLNIEIKKCANEKFKEVFDIVSKIVSIESVKFLFFTPYFNDGDPCVKRCYVNVDFYDKCDYEYRIESLFEILGNLLMDCFSEESVTITKDSIYIDDYTEHH